MVRAWLLDGGKLEPLPLSHSSDLVLQHQHHQHHQHQHHQQPGPSLMLLHYNSQYYLQPVQEGVGPVGGDRGGLRGAGNQELVENANKEVCILCSL